VSEQPERPPLLAPPTPSQQEFINEVVKVYLTHQRWPHWQYVEDVLERKDLDAAGVLAGMPTEAHGYSYVWPAHRVAPQPPAPVGLTAAGMQAAAQRQLVDAFVHFVGALGKLRKAVPPDPFAETRPVVTKAQVNAATIPAPHFEGTILEMLQHEPATWQCQLNRGTGDDWTMELSPVVRRFAGVEEVDDYLDRMRQLAPSSDPQAETLVSPFTLAGAIDYLDVVWHLRFDEPLVVPPGIERSARLAFNATSVEEVDSRLSALAEVLKNLRVPGGPGVGGYPLERLGTLLCEELPGEAHERVRRAVSVLDAARQLRASGQHASARNSSVEACRILGLPYPVFDWPGAWSQVQMAAATAFDALRDEIQANT
jgi:hypothetical protein